MKMKEVNCFRLPRIYIYPFASQFYSKIIVVKNILNSAVYVGHLLGKIHLDPDGVTKIEGVCGRSERVWNLVKKGVGAVFVFAVATGKDVEQRKK